MTWQAWASIAIVVLIFACLALIAFAHDHRDL